MKIRTILKPNFGLRKRKKHISVQELIDAKHDLYTLKAWLYKFLYYSTRTVAGSAACILPFVITTYHRTALCLSITIAAVTVLDVIFNPRGNWAKFLLFYQ